MATSRQRTNEQWLTDLKTSGITQEKALADLHATLSSGLPYALQQYLSSDDPNFSSLVEEAVQEALLKILDKLDTFRGQSRFTTWAHKIAIHVALTELRRKRWQDVSLDNLLTSDDGEYTPSFISDRKPSPERTSEQIDLMRQVQKIIDEGLTEKQRLALVATRIKGMPMAEVASRMGMKQNALYKLLHDARLRLRTRLAEVGLTTDEILASFEHP